MSLEITEARAVWSGGGRDGAGGVFAVSNTPARVLVADEHGRLIPCRHQYWIWDDDSGISSGCYYVPSGEGAVDPATLGVLQRASHRSRTREGESFHDFVRDLMRNPPAGAQFVRYDGVEKVTASQEYWRILGFRITKKRKVCFVHSFSLLGIGTPRG